MTTKDKIIDATIYFLLKKGFHGTRINEITVYSKTSKGSFYYYFPKGKEQVCIESLKAYSIKLSFKYRELFEKSNTLEGGLRNIIEYSKTEIEKSQYNNSSLLINISQEIDSNYKEIQMVCKDLFKLIINTIESFFLKYDIKNWKQSSRVFVLKLKGAIVLSKACETTIFLTDLSKEYSEFK